MSYQKYRKKSSLITKIKNPTSSDLRKRKYLQKTYDIKREFLKEEIERRGGCCEFCGVIEYHKVFQWHHINDEEKLRNIGKMASQGGSLANFKIEVDKCVVLCPTCHHKFHQDLLCMLDHRQKHIDGTFYDVPVKEVEEDSPQKYLNVLSFMKE